MANGDFTPYIPQSDDAGPSRADTFSPYHDKTGGPFAYDNAFDYTLETIDSASTPESQQVWFGRNFQADFFSSLPGVKQICWMLQGS